MNDTQISPVAVSSDLTALFYLIGGLFENNHKTYEVQQLGEDQFLCTLRNLGNENQLVGEINESVLNA